MAGDWLGWPGILAFRRRGSPPWRLLRGWLPRHAYNRGMATLFISDLHLDPERPGINRPCADFIEGEARDAEALYILGDVFEAWVGDDDPSDTGAFVADRLKALADHGVPVPFMHGNRDFLVGEAFA